MVLVMPRGRVILRGEQSVPDTLACMCVHTRHHYTSLASVSSQKTKDHSFPPPSPEFSLFFPPPCHSTTLNLCSPRNWELQGRKAPCLLGFQPVVGPDDPLKWTLSPPAPTLCSQLLSLPHWPGATPSLSSPPTTLPSEYSHYTITN